ncbi:GNAT family N-acetyltransferase [Alicyclobacillus sp. SO9]|uniref:GNAT family N-acetyltransferase n=1 Tax=Alicyclobacillus sp. SO9 TaxID=2665646 RepID=UPI0018E7CE94|nr:GNAT family N-acetyltransferase [Alicyclobacillus sp. SO9]QQE77854.1 GNAT family N-acetyltransferase [Alicyclobacillus sp. SO9]
MDFDDIVLAIEAEQYDFEPTLRIPGLHEIRNDELILRISDRSSSVFANKVVRSVFSSTVDDQINEVIDLYKSKGKSFSWWIGPKTQPHDLSTRLQSLGFTREDVYIGLAASVNDASFPQPLQWTVEECISESQLRDHVSVNAIVWGMDSASVEAAVRERKSYVSLPGRRGGYILARNREGKAVGNGTFRISSDGRTMYLIGSAVLPECRNQGVYHALLRYRFTKAREAGCELFTVQARAGTSEPILRRLGFQEYCTFEMLVKRF